METEIVEVVIVPTTVVNSSESVIKLFQQTLNVGYWCLQDR